RGCAPGAEERPPVQQLLKKPFLLLDAGGTLVYPNAPLLQQACLALGCELAAGSLLSPFFHNIFEVDVALRDGRALGSTDVFLAAVLTRAGAPADVARRALLEAKSACGSTSLWTYALPWAHSAVERLHAEGYRMAVVSNSDGTVRNQMVDLGLMPS